MSPHILFFYAAPVVCSLYTQPVYSLYFVYPPAVPPPASIVECNFSSPLGLFRLFPSFFEGDSLVKWPHPGVEHHKENGCRVASCRVRRVGRCALRIRLSALYPRAWRIKLFVGVPSASLLVFPSCTNFSKAVRLRSISAARSSPSSIYLDFDLSALCLGVWACSLGVTRMIIDARVSTNFAFTVEYLGRSYR